MMVQLSLLSLIALAFLISRYSQVDASTPFLSARKADSYWSQFKTAHGKTYESAAVESDRKRTFLKNILTIVQHNIEADLGLKSFRLGLNKYADMNSKEFRQVMGFLPMKRSPKTKSARKVFYKRSVGDHPPGQVDWREQKDPKVLNDVQDQGACGSCWTFSTAASIEAAHAWKTNTLVKLSEQNLVDCARGPEYVSLGCSGGTMTEGFSYVIKNGGINLLEAYPYEHEDKVCRFVNSSEAIGATLSGYVELDQDEDHIRDAVAKVGPVSIAIDAGSPFFQFYVSGVYDDVFCSPAGLNHGVNIAGYGSSKEGSDYWLVRNSWGPDWGEKGYIRMARGKNLCGIAEEASYPLV